MQIIVKEGAYAYTYDSSVFDKTVDGETEKAFPTPAEAIEAALDLLGCSYGRDSIAKALKDVHFG